MGSPPWWCVRHSGGVRLLKPIHPIGGRAGCSRGREDREGGGRRGAHLCKHRCTRPCSRVCMRAREMHARRDSRAHVRTPCRCHRTLGHGTYNNAPANKTQGHTHTRTHTHTHTHTRTHTHTHTHTHAYTRTHTHTHAHTRARAHTHTHTHTHTRTHTHRHAHTHTHAHAHTHTRTRARTHAHTHAGTHTCARSRSALRAGGGGGRLRRDHRGAFRRRALSTLSTP